MRERKKLPYEGHGLKGKGPLAMEVDLFKNVHRGSEKKELPAPGGKGNPFWGGLGHSA